MEFKELFGVFNNNRMKYFIWLGANIGGILIPIFAALTIYLLHSHFGNLLPGKDVFLATGIISILISFLSYWNTRDQSKSQHASSVLIISGPIVISLIYGFLVASGVKKPLVSSVVVFSISLLLFLLCIIWSSFIWLHEQGILSDMQGTAQMPEKTEGLELIIPNLPKFYDRDKK